MVWAISQRFFVVILGLFAPRHPTVPALFVAKPILTLLNHLCTLLKISCHRYVSLILDNYCGPLICPSISMPIIHCLDNCGFIISIFYRKQLWRHLALELPCGKISIYKILLTDKGLTDTQIIYFLHELWYSCKNIGSLSFKKPILICQLMLLLYYPSNICRIYNYAPFSLLIWLIGSFSLPPTLITG